MNKLSRILPFLWLVLIASLCGFSEDKNGLQVSVTKATLSRADQRGGIANTDMIDRTQGLKVTITNTSFKGAPEGEVEWLILVRKYNSTVVESYNGVEKLKPLGRAESVEMMIGSAPILGFHDGASLSMDKIEWKIIVKREGKDVYSATSTPSFENLARRATPGAVPAPKPK